METTRFDAVARLFGSGMSRREALRGLVAGTAALSVGVALLQAEDASAKRRRKKNRMKNKNQNNQNEDRGLAEASPCESDGQCRATENLICEIPPGAGNNDKACCRGTGATCSPSQPCCTGEQGVRKFQCVSGTCQLFEEPL